jgi:hypothetical protein
MLLAPAWPTLHPNFLFTGDSVQGRRPRPIEYSDAYYVRLKIHQLASYATVPLFVTEYFVGQSIINQGDSASSSLRSAHGVVAGSIGVLFGVNTITGVWNLADSWKDPSGRARRLIHASLMIAADAGFVLAASSTPRGFGRLRPGAPPPVLTDPNTHKNLAIASMIVSLASYGMMLVWK